MSQGGDKDGVMSKTQHGDHQAGQKPRTHARTGRLPWRSRAEKRRCDGKQVKNIMEQNMTEVFPTVLNAGKAIAAIFLTCSRRSSAV